MKILVLIISLFGYVLLHAQTAFNIATHIDGSLQFDALSDMEVLADGSIITVGRHIDYTNETNDSIYVAKFNMYGQLVWENKVLSLPDDIDNAAHYAYGLISIGDTLFAVQEVTRTVLIHPELNNWQSKPYLHFFDSNGILLSTIEPESSLFAGHRYDQIAFKEDKIIMLGYGLPEQNPDGEYDWVVLILDLEGNTIAEFTQHEPEDEKKAGVILVLQDGRVIITTRNEDENEDFSSFTLVCISSDLTEIEWSETYDASLALSITESLDGNILVGSAEIVNLGFDLYFHGELMEIDSENGQVLWTEPYHNENNSNEYLYGIHQSDDGAIYTGGVRLKNFSNELEGFLAKFNPDRSIAWEKFYKCFEEQDEEYIQDMVATPDGGFLLGGWSRGIDEEQEEIWLIKTDSLGNDSIPIGAYFVQDTLFLNHGESKQMNPIPYGGSNSYTHQWTGNTVYLDETQTWHPTFTGSQAGTFILNYTATDAVDGNVAMAQIVVIVYPADALTELNPDNWQVYPNPATDQIQINTDYEGKTLLELYAMDGRLLRQAAIQGNEIISLQGFPSGLLSLQVYADDGMLLHKAKVLKR